VAPTVQLTTLQPGASTGVPTTAIPTLLPTFPSAKSFSPTPFPSTAIPSFASLTSMPTETPSTLIPTVTPSTAMPTNPLNSTDDGAGFSQSASSVASAYAEFEGAHILAYLIPPSTILLATYLAMYFRRDRENDLNELSNTWMTAMTTAISCLSWIGIINSFFESQGSGLIYDQLDIALLAIAKGINVVGWFYLIYNFIFTPVSSSGVRNPSLLFLLNDDILKSKQGFVSSDSWPL
jgi:hypothetical protein